MEFLSLTNRYTFLNEGVIYVNGTGNAGQLGPYLFVAFPVAMLAMAAGLVGNVLLIIATRKSPRLKAPIFQLLFAIAFADIILLISFSLPEIASKFNDGRWMFGSKGCTLLAFFQFLPAHVTSCLIVVCCWERFNAVCRPHSAMMITSRKMSGIIAITWLLNAGVLAPLIVMTKEVLLKYPAPHEGADLPTATSCYLEMEPHIKQLYFTIMGMVFYGITAIVSIAYLACTICKAMNVDLENYFIKDDFKNHILRSTAVITTISIIFYLPYRYIYFYNLHTRATVNNDNDVMILLGTVMVILGGAVKPFVYITASSRFRKSAFRALKCCGTSRKEYEQTHGFRMSEKFVESDRPLLNVNKLAVIS
ncbi:thyrotropin-releasing hormone receptor-like [Watersipora subatra]|uniref:thyrotropin-releasing hormone receptor-like n=1 Tax=Watersipora subatra TaxID=2589382 RepID=UPI00355B1A2A